MHAILVDDDHNALYFVITLTEKQSVYLSKFRSLQKLLSDILYDSVSVKVSLLLSLLLKNQVLRRFEFLSQDQVQTLTPRNLGNVTAVLTLNHFLQARALGQKVSLQTFVCSLLKKWNEFSFCGDYLPNLKKKNLLLFLLLTLYFSAASFNLFTLYYMT